MICAEGIVYPYGGGILSGTALSVEKGECLGILGANCSGKSLLLEILSTLRRPFAGSLKILGKDAIRRPDSVRRYIGYVPEYNHYLDGFSVEGYLAAFGRCYGFKGTRNVIRRKDVIRMMELEAYINTPMEILPLSVLKRISLARCLIHQPGIIIIDNLFMGLDDKWRTRLCEVLMCLKREGMTMISSMTSMSEFEESWGLWNKVETLSNGVLKPYT